VQVTAVVDVGVGEPLVLGFADQVDRHRRLPACEDDATLA
jgi:hypothetical protein